MVEVAIPMAVLGVMYIISNKDNETKKKEGFHNRPLPNVKVPQINYPIQPRKDLLNRTNVQTYAGYKNKNENLYQPEGYKNAQYNKNNNRMDEFTSLTGHVVGAEGLEHNNMVPFFGSKITQGTDNKGNITSSAVAGINNIPGTPYSSMYIMTSSCIEIFPTPSIKNKAERSKRPINSTICILIFFYKFF